MVSLANRNNRQARKLAYFATPDIPVRSDYMANRFAVIEL
jgi:hypothetical protein